MEGKRHRLIGLTGGIGAGKSVVSRILRLKGYTVYDCDLRASVLMENSETIVSELTGRFGEGCYLPDGRLNRILLAQRIFSDANERLWVNNLVHQAVKADLLRWIEENGDGFVESAILHSSGLEAICSEIWVIEAPEELRFERALIRGGISEENLRARMEVQRGEFNSLPLEKVRRIDNSGKSSLLERIDFLLGNHGENKNI